MENREGGGGVGKETDRQTNRQKDRRRQTEVMSWYVHVQDLKKNPRSIDKQGHAFLHVALALYMVHATTRKII